MSNYRFRKKHALSSILILILSLLFVYGNQHGWFGTVSNSLETNQPGTYKVTRFVDGDTIVVDMNGHNETVRFIGVDTPETHKPNTPVQCYGPAAAAFTKNQIGNQRIRLEADSLSTDRDRYGRILRYVYLLDGTNLDEKIIRNGYGFYYPYFPFTKSASFNNAEKLAISENKGLWANCHPTPTDSGGYVSNPQQ